MTQQEEWALERHCVLTENTALRAQVAMLREALALSRKIADEAHDEWDADNDSRVGKLLLALAGHRPKYRWDINKIQYALAATEADATAWLDRQRKLAAAEELDEQVSRINMGIVSLRGLGFHTGEQELFRNRLIQRAAELRKEADRG